MRLLRLPVGSGQLGTPKERAWAISAQPLRLKARRPQTCRSDFVWPSREQEQQALQDQLAAAAAQQAAQQGLQQAREVFEFTYNILGRGAQVALVREFVSSLSTGQPLVKQMLMGGGKTTVGPLLTVLNPTQTGLGLGFRLG